MHIYRAVHTGTKSSARRRRLEGALIGTTALLTFLVSSRTELYERLHAELTRYEGFQADELVFVLLSVLAGLAVFSFLRWREARSTEQRIGANIDWPAGGRTPAHCARTS